MDTMPSPGVQIKNDGEMERILIKNHHDAIIPSQDFEMVQEIKNVHAKFPVQETFRN